MGIPILAGLEVVKGVAGLFKKRGKPNTGLENAIAVVEDTVTTLKRDTTADPEATKLLYDKELELEREYTKQAQAALQVMNTEAGSSDAMVRRARPTLMYVGYLVMLCQLVIFPFFKIRITEFVDKEIVYWFYWMFSSGYLGYGVLRSMDKNGKGPQFPSFFGGK